MMSAGSYKLAVYLAASAPAAESHSLRNAVIIAGIGAAAVVFGPIVAEMLKKKTPVDHLVETVAEQAVLIEHLREQCVELTSELTDAKAEIQHLKRPPRQRNR